MKATIIIILLAVGLAVGVVIYFLYRTAADRGSSSHENSCNPACKSGEVCQDGGCVPKPAACPSGQKCQKPCPAACPSGQKCRKPCPECCGNGAQCSSDEHCTAKGSCQPGKICDNQSDCTSTYYCEDDDGVKSCQHDPYDGRCVLDSDAEKQCGSSSVTYFFASWAPPSPGYPYGSCPVNAPTKYLGVWECSQWDKNRKACPRYVFDLTNPKLSKCSGPLADAYKQYSKDNTIIFENHGLTDDDTNCFSNIGSVTFQGCS